MAKKKNGNKITVRIEKELHITVRSRVIEYQTTVSEITREAWIRWLQDHPPKSGQK